MDDSLVAQWRQTRITPYVSPNLARAYHARKYAKYLKKKAERIERNHRRLKRRMLAATAEEDRELVEHHIDIELERVYNKVILPLVYQAVQVEQTAEELLMSSSGSPPPRAAPAG